MEQLSFWLKLLIWIIIIVITLYGVLKILIEKTPDLLLKILKKKQDDVYVPEWLVHERDEILRCKNKLRHDYGLTWGEIDNYIKESKEASKVFRRSYKARHRAAGLLDHGLRVSRRCKSHARLGRDRALCPFAY